MPVPHEYFDHTARTSQFQEDLRERLGNMPGVTAVTLAAAGPMSRGLGVFPLVSEGATSSSGDSAPHAECDVVSAGFFQTLGVPVVRGRPFADSDREGSATVAMVSQELVRRILAKAMRPPSRQANTPGSGEGDVFFEVVGVAGRDRTVESITWPDACR